MPFTTPHTGDASPATVPSAPASAATSGRTQEPTPATQAAKKEQGMSAASRHVRRHEPTASSSSSSSSSSSGAVRDAPLPPQHAPHDHPTRSLRLHVGVFSKRKGVRYNADGSVVKCRFCEILRDRDEPFLYEDELLVVFRPLHPIVPSHILIVPRAHIRNVNQLHGEHLALLRRMRVVAERVLHTHPELTSSNQPQGSSDEEGASQMMKRTVDPKSPNDVSSAARDVYPGFTTAELDDEASDQDDTDCRFAFHVPPFNSIDHVHMHAFRGETGYFGRLKYRTESWWCRSYDEVLARLELRQDHRQGGFSSTAPSSAAAVCS